MAKTCERPPTKPSGQAGVAAIEFALIAILMVLMLLGIMIYWRVLQAQQSVTRSAGDGARIVQSLIYGPLSGYDITKQSGVNNIAAAASNVVKSSLQGSGIPGTPQQDTTVTMSSDANNAYLSVIYRLPPLFGSADGQPRPIQLSNWALTEPANLQATAVIFLGASAGNAP